MLCVLPSYQRRGIGDMLVREGLAFADRDGARTYVEASPMGLPLYLRHGWKEVDENVIDMRRYGLDRIESGKCLMRAPGGE